MIEKKKSHFVLEDVMSEHISRVKSISGDYYMMQIVTPELEEQFELIPKENKHMSIRDPHIAQVYYREELQEGGQYLLMEDMFHGLVEDSQHSKKLTIYDMLALTKHAALAVNSLHRHNKVHGAIHKSQLYINERDEQCYGAIRYYGMLRLDNQQRKKESPYWTGLPTSVLKYEEKLTPVDDLYGLGVLLYELCMGRPLYTSQTIEDLLKERTQKKIHYDRNKISKEIENICKKALSEDDDGYMSCKEFIDDIEMILNTNPSEKIESNVSINPYGILPEEDMCNTDIQEQLKIVLDTKGLGEMYRYIAAYYYRSEHLVCDYEKSLLYERKAAIEERNSLSMHNLGVAYDEGNIVEEDFFLAREYYIMAIESGERKSFVNLGVLCELGQGGETELEAAKLLYECGAQAGCPQAMCRLGRLYEKGRGVEQNYTIAKKYYEESVECDGDNACFLLALLYESGKGVEQDYKKAFEYLQKGAELEDQFSMNHLGIYYENGYGTKKDMQKSLEYYHKAAEDGSVAALRNLAIIYDHGREGVPINKEAAMKLYEAAARKGNQDALWNLALCYEERNEYDKAKECYEILMEDGYSPAYNNLGALYKDGDGGEVDYKKAHELFERSIAIDKYHYAYFNMAVMYTEGLGVKKDHKKACVYMEKAIEEGSTEYEVLWIIRIRKFSSMLFGW